jgi:hypothetical protein
MRGSVLSLRNEKPPGRYVPGGFRVLPSVSFG